MADTELKLRLWRGGDTAAERLAATLLHLEGYGSVDPQCPLGGPDGLKDVLCERNGWKYVCAAFFPAEDHTFTSIRTKFLKDLAGVAANGANGIVFLTNQSLSPAERERLEKAAEKMSSLSIIYHRERIRGLLDSPAGYGARLQFLDIEMTREEQTSFFATWNRAFSDELRSVGQQVIDAISAKIDFLRVPALVQEVHVLSHLAERTLSALSRTLADAPHASVEHNPVPTLLHATEQLSVATMCFLHRAVTLDRDDAGVAGQLRDRQVWIGASGDTRATARYVPPPPDQVPDLLSELARSWREGYPHLLQMTSEEKVEQIARFHNELLRIHPFVDGNGRLARLLLAQQAYEILGVRRTVTLQDRKPYLDALTRAQNGDLAPLVSVLTQAMFGVEFVPGSP